MASNGPKALARRRAAGTMPDLTPAIGPAGADKQAEARVRLAKYSAGKLHKTRWAEIEDFVREVGSRLIDVGMVNLDNNHARAVAYMADWLRSHAIELTVENLLDPRNVNLFASGLSPRSAPTYQATLRRAGKALRVARRETLRPLDGRQVAVPYTATEVSEYWRLTRLQPSPGRAQTLRVALVLGLGCGLPARTAVKVEAGHIGYEYGVLGVSASGPARFVPVLDMYAEELLAAKRDFADSPTLFGEKSNNSSYASDRLARIELPRGCPVARFGRLRSTWLLHHLTVGTRIPELAAAAGILGVTTLSDLLEFIPPLDADPTKAAAAVRQMLAGRR